jgi:hypothetical protein
VDPYNDFLWPHVREVAEEVGLLDNLRAITAAIRKAGIRIFIVRITARCPGISRAGSIRPRKEYLLENRD